MFYSQVILAKKGPLGKIWIAAHFDKKLTKQQIFSTDITSSVDLILNPSTPLALRVSGHLMLGVVRIFQKKVKYLMSDCTEAMWKLRLTFRPGKVDMDPKYIGLGIDDVRFFGHAPQIDLEFPMLEDVPFPSSLLPIEPPSPQVPGSPALSEVFAPRRREGLMPSPIFPSRRPSFTELSTAESRMSDVQFARREDARPSLARSSISLERRASSFGAGRMDEELPAYEDHDARLFEEFRYDHGLESIAETHQEGYYSSPMDVVTEEERLASRAVPSPIIPMMEVEEEVPPSMAAPVVPVARRAIKSTDIDAIMPPPTRKRPVVKGRVRIDERVELSNAIINQRLQDSGPTLRRHVTDPFPFVESTPSIWDTLDQRVDIRYDVADELLELMNMVTDRAPFPFPLKRPRLEAEPTTTGAVITAQPISAEPMMLQPPRDRLSSFSVESAGDMEFARALSGSEIGRSRASQAAFQHGDQFGDMREISFDQQSFTHERTSEVGTLFPESVVSYEMPPMITVPPEFETVPSTTEFSKRVEDAIRTLKDETKPATLISELSEGIYGFVHEKFSETESVKFQDLVAGCSKSTAAKCFLEILQLKMANKINVSQPIPQYGDIEITPIPCI